MNKSKNSIRICSFGFALLFWLFQLTGQAVNSVSNYFQSYAGSQVQNQQVVQKKDWLEKKQIAAQSKKAFQKFFVQLNNTKNASDNYLLVLAEGDQKDQETGYLDYSNLAPPVGGLEGKLIEINLTRQTFTCWENGKVWGHFMTSTGRPGMATKAGMFKVFEHDPMAWAPVAKCWMPWFLGIYRAGSMINGIHELPLFGGVQEGAYDLGHPVSHGCVRLAKGIAKSVYDWAVNGTPVYIHY